MVTGQAAGGTSSLKLTPTDPATAVCTQDVTVTPGTTYTLSAQLKSSGAFISVGARNIGEVASNATSYTAKSVDVTATSSTLTVYVQAYRQQTGDTWADLVSLVAK